MNKNSYILHLKNIKSRDEELAGSHALEKSLLIKEGFPTLPGFVLTSLAFDDYLRSTNLVEPISLLLGEIKPFIKETAESVAEEIRTLILKTDIPKIIELPLLEAYKNLSPVLEDSFVSVEISNVIDPNFIPKGFNFKIDNIKGIVQISEAIKEGWLTLFTPEALEYRVNEYYHGPLSIALVISRMGSGDVSGEFVYTSENQAEIRAIYGIGDIAENINQSDIYYINTQNKVILDKVINTQEKIKIRRGSNKKGRTVLIDMEVSEEWKNKQKVPNTMINNILESASKLSSVLKAPFKFSWSIEAGSVFIENYSVLTSYEKPVDLTKIISKTEENKEEAFGTSNQVEQKPISGSESTRSVLDIEKDDTKSIVILNSNPEFAEDSYLDPAEDYSVKDIDTVLDISSMTSSRIHSVQHFDKVYFDGSENIFNSGAWKSFDTPDKAVETIYVELLAAVRASISKGFIYSFSNLTYSNEPKIQEGQFTGDERFIDNPQELIIEYIALRKAIDNLKIKDFAFTLPSLRTYNNLKDLLRILRTYPGFGLVNNKIYAEISIPSFLFELTKIGDEVDGFILDYYKLLKLMVYRKNLRVVDNQIMFDVMNEVKKVADYKNLKLFIKLDSYKDPIIDQILELGKVGIIFRSVPSASIFEKLKKGDKVKLNLSL